ncbi:MAG: hypothetical protein R3C53_04745 [Pirellulaceae bacterium]
MNWYVFQVFNSDREHVYDLRISQGGKEFKIKQVTDFGWKKGTIKGFDFLHSDGTKLGTTDAFINQPQFLDTFVLTAGSGRKYNCVKYGDPVTGLESSHRVASHSLIRL